MSELPQEVQAGDIVFEQAEAPEGVAVWTTQVSGWDDAFSASFVIEPPAVPSAEAIDSATSIINNFGPLRDIAVQFLSENLRKPEYNLTADEIDLLNAGELPFESPEVVVWSDATWMLRFAESSIGIAHEYGIGVNFVGEAPQSVEDLSDAGGE